MTYIAAKKVDKRSIKHEKCCHERLTGENITFNDKDTDRLLMPQNNNLGITLCILDIDAKRVLIDPDSSADLI